MKEKTLDWRKVLSLLLIVALVLQISPVQAFAVGQDESVIEQTETIAAATEEPAPEATVIGEVEGKREEDVKHFLNSDGSFTAVKYAEPVHYRQTIDAEWVDIDNTLSMRSGSYTPASSPLDVSFADSFGDRTVSVRSQGHELSWSYLRPDAEITPPDIVETQELTPAEGTETQALKPIEDADISIKAQKLELAAEKAEPYMMPEAVTDGLVYADVFPNVDIEYILDSVNLKENIVLKKSGAQNEFVAQYNIGELTAEQVDEQNIELRDAKGTVIFCISAPYMFDAAGQTSGDVSLGILSETDGVLRVKITADKAWLDDEARVYPVKVDPYVLKAVQYFDQDATAIYKSAAYPDGSLVIGNDKGNAYSKAKSYVKFSLPTLGSGDMVVSGFLCLSQYAGGYGFSVGDVTSLQVNVYKVTSSWTGSSIKKTTGYSNLPSIDTTVVDYQNVSLKTANAGIPIQFDVSKTVKQWYEGETNYGLCLRADDESAWAMATFVASENTDYPNNRPTLVVTYRNNKGLESYWTTHKQNLGESGVGYVNDYTGNLVYIAPILSTTGNKMPVSLSLVYNGYQHGSNIDRPDTVGKGWRLNIQEKLTPITQTGTLNAELYENGYRYIYSDADGTEHYFYYNKEDNKILDEDGLGLTLTVNSTVSDMEKYVITADAGGKMSFTSSGRLRKVYDDNGNYYKVLFNDNGSISSVVDGAGRKISFTHDSSGRISTIKQPTGNNSYRTVTLKYSSWGGLSSISYPGSRTTSFYYTDSGARLNIVDAIDENRLTYSYPTTGDASTKSRVTKITEYSSGSTRETGNSLSIDYNGMNRTRFKDNKERSETYQFDNFGRTKGVLDAFGNGSQYSYNDATEDNKKKNNTLKSAGSASKYIDNRLINHNFENGYSSWSYISDKTAVETSHYYYGSKSIKIMPQGAISQKVDKNQSYKYYTSSVYARGSSNESKLTLSIRFLDADGVQIGSKYLDQTLSSGKWERKQFTFKLIDGAESFRVRFYNCGTDDVWVDCAQLENGSSMSAYNMVQNGGFENIAASTWTKVNCTDSDGFLTGETYGRYFRMSGSGSANKALSQRIYINRSAKTLFLSVSGYAWASSVPLTESKDRQFALKVTFHFADGSTPNEEYISFNPDYSAGWQYTSGTVGVKSPGSKTVDYVTVSCCYYKNENRARFDRIKVNIDETGTSYTYDDDGNLISAKDNAGRYESYSYNNASDMTKLTTADNKAYKLTYSDTYKHRMLSATSESSGVKNSFEYDGSGNLTKTRVDKSGYAKYIEQGSTYTSNGNYLAKSTAANGYSTTYNYNAYKGTLDSVTDANGKETKYTYDANTDRMTSVEAVDKASAADNSKVTYIYEPNGQLTSIKSPGSSPTYNFVYDKWGNNTEVKVGSQTLVTNTYKSNNGLLTQQKYGNGFTVGHNYDSLDRETSRSYNGATKFYWTYNADGNLARYSENGNRVLTYLYDDIGRLLQVSGNDGSYVKTSYDELDKSTDLHYKFNGQRRDVYFHYSDKDNLPLDVKFGTGTAYAVTNLYDGLTRVYEKDYTLVGNTSNSELKAEYSYVDWSGDNSDRTTGTVRGINYTFAANGLSTHDRWYTYDNVGNILTECSWISSSSKPVQESYTYDAKNQLVKHDSVSLNAIYTYEYDLGGNIKSKTIYNKDSGATSTINYTYGNSAWGDELTAYNGESIVYDKIGNPTTYRGWGMTWQGRQLTKAVKDKTVTFTYDSEGIRTSKSDGTNTTKYLLNGTQILAQTTNGKTLCFFYDQQGNRVGMADGSNKFYYYIYNLQGDVIALADASTGKLAVTYTYDAWGKLVKLEDTTANSVGTLNPFRYRGYYYDTETGLYYLQSRYYDPEVGRFINADRFATADYTNVLGTNTYAYCNNNPIINIDTTGTYSFLCTELGGNPNTEKYFKKEPEPSAPKEPSTIIIEDNSIKVEVNDDLAMVGVLTVEVSLAVSGAIAGTGVVATGVKIASAASAAKVVAGSQMVLSGLTEAGVGLTGNLATIVETLSSYSKNGTVVVEAYITFDPKEIPEWLIGGPIRVVDS